jgi:hypothetical protein
VRLFRRKNTATEQDPSKIDPESDEGIVGLYYSILGQAEEEFRTATAGHLTRLHEPGGYAREKQRHDFMDLGMKRVYLDALDDIEFTIEDALCVPEVGIKKRGMATIVTRWKARGTHNRPLPGIAPTGQPLTVEGITYTTFRNYNVRVEYTFWHIPEQTRRLVER